jgi:hypothetical protein
MVENPIAPGISGKLIRVEDVLALLVGDAY